ncbi:GAF domain-containing protein [Actinoplanes sp. NPDC049802]|uniref:GAF domain-containing protein n=1 Tax=Actinoplanes sp. NPDC049802 TaxID=3154742 RepID=UPI0033C82DE5
MSVTAVSEAVNDPARLRTVAAIDFDHPGLRAALDLISRRTAEHTGLPVSLATVVMNTAQLIAGSSGIAGTWLAESGGTPIEWSFCVQTVATGRPYVVRESRTDPVQARNPLSTMGVVPSYAGVPVFVDGQVVGAHCLVGGAAHTFTDADLSALEEGARDIAQVLLRHLDAG